MRKIIRGLGIFFLVFCCGNISLGQVRDSQKRQLEKANIQFDKKETAPIVTAKLHSPSKAALYEALVPGLGHIYNKKIWHVPITYAAFGTAIYFVVDNSKKYRKYRNAYADFSVYLKYIGQKAQYPLPIPEPKSQRFREVRNFDFSRFSDNQLKSFKNALRNNKNAFRRYRDLSYISVALVYILNVVWATTDAHFFDYDISDDLSLHFEPRMLVLDEYKQGVGVNLVLNF